MSSLSFSTGHEEAVKSSSPLGHGVPEVKVMSQLQSDVVIDATKFRPEAVSEQTARVNKHYLEVFESAPKWYELGAARYREMRLRGETALAGPVLLDSATDIEVPSRDAGRSIPCRLMYPSARKTSEERAACKGTVLHIHGGGWVLGDEKSADLLMLHYADAGDLAVLSVGYRLAPENPFPKGPEDCVDVAGYLVENSQQQYGGPLRFIGGESAGAHLSLLVTYHLLTNHPTHHLTGLLLHFGAYNLALSPSARLYTKPLLLNRQMLQQFIAAFLPDTPIEELSTGAISPYYADLSPFRGRLPSALFTCGTDDPLLDDSLAMGTKWMVFGGETLVKFYPGCPHAFIGMGSELEEARNAVLDAKAYIRGCMANSL